MSLTHAMAPLFCFMCVGVRFEFDMIDGPSMGFPWPGLGDFELLFSIVVLVPGVNNMYFLPTCINSHGNTREVRE